MELLRRNADLDLGTPVPSPAEDAIARDFLFLLRFFYFACDFFAVFLISQHLWPNNEFPPGKDWALASKTQTTLPRSPLLLPLPPNALEMMSILLKDQRSRDLTRTSMEPIHIALLRSSCSLHQQLRCPVPCLQNCILSFPLINQIQY